MKDPMSKQLLKPSGSIVIALFMLVLVSFRSNEAYGQNTREEYISSF